MSADILVYVLIAAGLIFWLRNILGTEDEDDIDRRASLSNEIDKKMQQDGGNVVSLDALVGKPLANLPRHIRIDNKTTENNLEDIAKKYEDFDIYHFAQGAEQAFKIIIEAFADGDLKTLKDLLDQPVYDAFENVIKERSKKGEVVATNIKSIEKIDITEAILDGDLLKIVARFTAIENCLIRDKEGEIIAGDPDKDTQMVDVWVFGRDMKSEGPEWYLYETRDDEIEDHKTPLPDTGKDK